jgi:hypothetical protein
VDADSSSGSRAITVSAGHKPYYGPWLAHLQDRFDRCFIIEEGRVPAESDATLHADLKKIASFGIRPADVVMIDRSTELGTLNKNRLEIIAGFCAESGLAQPRVLYIRQNKLLRSVPNGPQTIFGHHYMHGMATAYANLPPSDEKWEDTFGSRKFLCLNLKLRPHRLAILNEILGSELRQRAVLSWGASPKLFSFEQTSARALEDFPSFATHLLPELQTFQKRIPADNFAHGLGPIYGFPATETCETFMNLVAETEYTRGAIRFTEKTLKSIASFRPFVVFGSAHTLACLRDWGFRTFGDAWAETYDGETSPDERMCLTLQALRQALATPTPICVEKIEPILRHNQNHLRNGVLPLMEKRFCDEVAAALTR